MHSAAAAGCGLTKIGERAFARCGAMTEIVIPETVKIIENGAFEQCGQLRCIRLQRGQLALYRNYSAVPNLETELMRAMHMLRFRCPDDEIAPEVKFPLLYLRYLQTHDANIREYLKRNIAEFVRAGDLPVIEDFLNEPNFIRRQDAADRIALASQCGHLEIAMQLMNYKNSRFGADVPEVLRL